MSDAPVPFQIRIETEVGPIGGTLAVSPGPMRLCELVPLVASLASVIVGRAIQRDRAAGHALSCRAGCGACCRQLVPISAPEAFLIADLVASLPAERRAAVEERFAAAEAHFAASDLAPALAELAAHAEDRAAYNAVAGAYFTHGVACPFLVDESCSVHEHRPIACRDYNVTSDAGWCAQPLLHPIRKVPTPPSLSSPLARLTARLTGEPLQMVPLSLALAWSADHRALGDRTWPGVALLTAFIEEAGRK